MLNVGDEKCSETNCRYIHGHKCDFGVHLPAECDAFLFLPTITTHHSTIQPGIDYTSSSQQCWMERNGMGRKL